MRPTHAPRMRPLAIAVTFGLLAAGCASSPEAVSLARRDDLGTAPITHVVLVQLKDPTRIAELIADCDRALPGIDGVAGYSCGVPLDMGRSNVSQDYDVGIYVGFANAEAYRTYVDHPSHLALVNEWRDGWKAVRIFDVVSGDPGAVRSVTDARARGAEPGTAAVPSPPATTAAPAAGPAAPPTPPAPAAAQPSPEPEPTRPAPSAPPGPAKPQPPAAPSKPKAAPSSSSGSH